MTLALGIVAATVVFAGFDDARYQRFDSKIAAEVQAFNSARGRGAAATAEQAKGIPELDFALVKSHMIQESGGTDPYSRTAWAHDPLQVNVPGDWNEYKRYLGLRKPRRTNDGSFSTNLRAGIRYLARKGFGVSGQPAANRPDGRFDGWEQALRRYNGRSDLIGGIPYREAYANRILQRARNPATNVVIQLTPTARR